MTIQSVLQELMEEFERPDLESKLANLVPQVLREAHGTKLFRRDLVGNISTSFVVDDSGRTTIQIFQDFPNIRKVRSIQQFAGIVENSFPVEEITPGMDFVDLAETGTETDFYGFKFPFTYSLIGSSLDIKGLSQRAVALKITAFMWPQITPDPVNNSITTDSWIVAEFPEYIKALLRPHIFRIIDKQSGRNASIQELQIARQNFIIANANQWE